MKNLMILSMLILLASCNNATNNESNNSADNEESSITKTYPTVGEIERFDPLFDTLVPQNAQLEILADSFTWSEGPVWVPQHDMLLFSDIPNNKIYKWTETDGLEEYLHPSGYTGEKSLEGEPGSNGLLLDSLGRLVLCQHGNRQIGLMEAPMNAPQPIYRSIVNKWEGKRFNSPNDAVFDGEGNLFFTDPPYGLPGKLEDPEKEIPFQGVYRYSKNGEIKLMSNDVRLPNGITFSLDYKTLYVANSDSLNAIWMAYDHHDDGSISNGRVFYDANHMLENEKGLPDGLKVGKNGNIWATGPGGVLVFTPEGKLLGRIRTGQLTSNCGFNEDKSELYITAHYFLMRLKLN